MGVLTAALDRGPFQLESSVFQGREPDEQRWDLVDVGPLDSWSVRGWYRPNDAWSFQVSHGFLTRPEEFEEGNLRRTTASGSWIRRHSRGTTASTVAYGRNDKARGSYNAVLAESTHTFGANAVYGRFEALQVESDVLRFGSHGGAGHHGHEDGAQAGGAALQAFTMGGVRTIARWSGWDVGAGADLTVYRVPDVLQPTHGERPTSVHLFVRVRPPAPMGRMTDMVMTRIGH
jgi:hypothetical protein